MTRIIGGRWQLVVLLACSWEAGPAAAIAADRLGGEAPLRRAAEESLERGTSWLLRQQAADGGWHSATYGQMRGGAGNSALALFALTGAWPTLSPAEKDQVRRGVQFLTANLDPAGFVRARDGSSDYPTYATALVVIAIDRAKLTEWAEPQQRMRHYLAEVQVESRASQWENISDVGGWGQTGGDPRERGSQLGANISVTRFAMDALHGSPVASRDAVEQGLAYASRLQCSDPTSDEYGGFCFTTLPDDPLNKAGWFRNGAGRVQARAYGTATADGLAALLVGGASPDDPRVRSAMAWLDRHAELDFVPGIPESDAQASGNREALRFYYYASLARAIERTSSSSLSQRVSPLVEQVVALQRTDGSWSNSSSLMGEDDPLVASAMAIETLTALRAVTEQGANP